MWVSECMVLLKIPCQLIFVVCHIQSISLCLFSNVWRYVGAITGLLSFFMFLPGIFNEYTVDKTSNQDNQLKEPKKISSKGSRHNPKSIVREFSTVSFTGPPPLETKKSVALLSIAETPIAQNKSFWGRLRTKWKPFFFLLCKSYWKPNKLTHIFIFRIRETRGTANHHLLVLNLCWTDQLHYGWNVSNYCVEWSLYVYSLISNIES